MSTIAAEPTPRRPLLLATGALALLAAVFLVPFRLASIWPGGYPDVSALSEQMSSAFVRAWHTGTASELDGPVDYWARFHIVKAILAGLLLLLLLPLGTRIWTSYARTARLGRRLLLAAAGCVHAAITVLTLLIVVANIQGAVAPLSSALGLMPLGSPDPALASTLEQVRHGLRTDQDSTVLDTLVGDYARYHVAFVVLGVVVSLALVALAVRLWRRRRRLAPGERRYRRVLLVGSVSLLVLAAGFVTITAANLTTVAHPATALLGLVNGSF